MSGPKVVRIVTREELAAAGAALLARLDAAVAQWRCECGDSLAGDVEATTERRNELAAMLAADRFAEFRQAATKEIDFLQADAALRRERAAQARAQERLREASGRELARSLLKDGSKNAAPQLRAELEKVASGTLSVAEMDAILSRARQALFQVQARGASAEQNAIAQRLGAAQADTSFEAWKARAAKPDLRLQAAFAHLAELEALGAHEAAALNVQLRSVQTTENEATRDMRLDTLVLALRKAKDGALSRDRSIKQIQLLVAELAAVAGDSAVLERLRGAGPGLSLEQLEVLVTLGREEVSRTQAAVSAVARRKAIVDGLQNLGYRVQEGLATMTIDAGRLIVRSPVSSDYGVEVVSGANQKVQVRTVAFDAARDTSQDVAEERRWCGDFGKLQAALQASGCEVRIEKALGVGAAPLRVVEVAEERLARQAAPGLAGRTR